MKALRLLVWILLPVTLAAEDHQIVAKTYYGTFSASHAVLLRIKPGDVVATQTLDSSGRNGQSEHLGPRPNPLTGPFFIEGAAPGDAIAVHLRKLHMNRNWGYSGYQLGYYSVTPEFVQTMAPQNQYPDVVIKGYKDTVRWDIDPAAQTVKLRDPVTGAERMNLPASPMIGCIGVAPEGEFTPTSKPSGPYGGNLDYNRIAQGATVFLPVYHPGALLYLGDGHALQGDGEPGGSAVETSLDVEFSVDVVKGAHLTGPRVETSEELISIGAQPEFESSLDRGLQLANTDMVKWLTGEYKMDAWVAEELIAMEGRYDVITVAGSLGVRVPKHYLPKHP